MFAGLDGRGSSMSASAGDREPGIPLDNAREEISGSTYTGENNKHVSDEANMFVYSVLIDCSINQLTRY